MAPQSGKMGRREEACAKISVTGATFPATSHRRGILLLSPISREEIFGPVLSILTYKNEAEAIRLANDSEFGLMAYVSSSNPERAGRVARQLQAGRVLINTLNHDPLAPFGGYKQSGIGREGGIYGLKEFLEPKAIIVG